jgi:hypothetical protein
MSTTALTTDGRFPVRRKRPNRPSVDNAFTSSWCPHFGDRFNLRSELHYGTGESAKSVTFQTSLPIPDPSISEDDFYKQEIAAMADALRTARIRFARRE